MHTSLFSEHREHIPRPPLLTPAESSEDDSDDGSPMHWGRAPTHLSLPQYPQNKELDLDMEDSQSPPWSPTSYSSQHIRPPPPSEALLALPAKPTQPSQHISTSNTRIPTPIYGHFRTTSTSTHPTTFPHPRDSHHNPFHQTRNLPSPITEDDSLTSPTSTSPSLLRTLDTRTSTTTPCTPSFPSSRSESEINMLTPLSDSTPALKSPWRDQRRGAVDVDQGFGALKIRDDSKIVFSMGFRADCEKCRGRVPGHWSHVLRV